MLHKTRGIILHQIKFSETSVIVKIYTEKFGIQSYLIKGIRSKKSKIKPALLQHLSCVDLIVYNRDKKDLNHIKEIKANYHYNSIPFNIHKSAIVIFINEVLNKTLREEEPNESLFDFLYRSITLLDNLDQGVSLYHNKFLLELTRYLGFYPHTDSILAVKYFNLEQGTLSNQRSSDGLVIDMPYSESIVNILNTRFEDLSVLTFSKTHKKKLLDIILQYYQLHFPGLGVIKSHKVLETTFND